MSTLTTEPISQISNEPVAENTPVIPAEVAANPLATKAGDWFPSIPKGSEKIFESYKDKPLTDVLNSFVEAQKVVGGSIRLPKADAKPEERDKALGDIYNKLGRPETPDKYELGELPALPENIKWDDAKLTSIKTQLHKAGLSNNQVKAALSMYAAELKTIVPDNSAVAAESRQALIDHYGSQAMFDRNISMAHKAVKEFGDAELITWLDSTGVGNAPAFVKFMSKIGKELVEHGAVEPSSEMDYLSTTEAQTKINEVNVNKADIYWAKPGTPGKAERMKEVGEWYKIVAGEI